MYKYKETKKALREVENEAIHLFHYVSINPIRNGNFGTIETIEANSFDCFMRIYNRIKSEFSRYGDLVKVGDKVVKCFYTPNKEHMLFIVLNY